ncbi:AraC family transcriptional regulator [Anaerovorax odorimutans]|uniref:AraC family transcriptional regulator n=1 Tax=Anaerovorax odorimutans TaxID=109327 RepID=A0ABT1RNI1_9FIRM|nr:AraC family transcriptional regulator [Anaerovorax odorimutans]MCQ4636728.1 AraC family transcriptional regulator [Anaerovorax odorimutans]
MRKINKIMDIADQPIDYINDSAVSIEICDIRHSSVHFHESAVELIYCLEGEVSIHCNHEFVTLKKGQIFTVDFEDIHCLYSDISNLLIIFHIDLHKLEKPWSFLQYVYLACEDNSCEPYQKAPLQQIKNMVLAAAYLYTKRGTLTDAEMRTVSNRIVNILLDYFDWFNYINIYPNKNDELRERFQAVSAYCQNNHTRKITIAELAEKVHINENYLSQFIRKSPFGSFSNMIGYIRCFAAQTLLLTTELSVIDISNRCGFSDDKYFYKHFKLAWGKTPKEHRQWYKDYIQAEDRITAISKSQAYKILEPYAAEYFAAHILLE